MVGASGFEPPTSWSRTRRSSQAEPRPAGAARIAASLSITSSPHIDDAEFTYDDRDRHHYDIF